MPEFVDQEFFLFSDRGGHHYEGHNFSNCQFINCIFSLTDDITKQSVARNITMTDCHICNGHLGAGILDDIVISGLSIDDSLVCWSPFFRHVVLRGNIGDLIINKWVTALDRSPIVQQPFDLKRESFYRDTDWALDISEACFHGFDLHGIPAQLVRIDSQTQGIVTQESALQIGWREKVKNIDSVWLYLIDEMLNEGEPDLILAAPKAAPLHEYKELLDSMNELKDLGVVLDSMVAH